MTLHGIAQPLLTPVGAQLLDHQQDDALVDRIRTWNTPSLTNALAEVCTELQRASTYVRALTAVTDGINAELAQRALPNDDPEVPLW